MPEVMKFLLGISPFGLLLQSGVLRLIADLTSERRSLDSFRRIAILLAYTFLVISIPMFAALVAVSVYPLLQFVGLMLAIIVLGTTIGADLTHASALRRAKQTELLWMLATAVRAQRPLAREVELYAEGTWGRRRRALLTLADGLRHGDSFSEIAVPSGLLPASITMQLHTAVESNTLAPALIDAAHRMIRELSVERTTHARTALVIPTVLIPITVSVVGFVMYFVIPKFKRIFDDFGTELPGLTITLIQLSDLFVTYWYLLVAPLFYMVLAACIVYVISIRNGWQAAYRGTVGRIFMRCHTPDILRMLSQSVGLGVPMTKALGPVARHAKPYSLRRRIARIVEAIENGTPGWQALHSAGLLTTHETAALESAERVGNLTWALESIASTLERRLIFRLRVFFEFMGPLLIVAVAFVIGLVVIALFLPLIKLLNDLS